MEPWWVRRVPLPSADGRVSTSSAHYHQYQDPTTPATNIFILPSQKGCSLSLGVVFQSLVTCK